MKTSIIYHVLDLRAYQFFQQQHRLDIVNVEFKYISFLHEIPDVSDDQITA